ncbi:hypothetical protein [Flexivirga aerilata]|uniref:hypothetical protein n=1 Tax=Flexivirga aerilata TaxID=1656889 RepID=UPI001BB289CB|nr:hypothetical protein [Flexivirga aerilata]
MKRNTALFSASLVAGVAAAGALVATSTSSSAASTYYGVNWSDQTSFTSSGGAWKNGSYGDAYGSFSGTAAAGTGTFSLGGKAPVTVRVACTDGKPVTTVIGGGAAGTYQPGATVSLAKFANYAGSNGSVTFGSVKVGGHTAGAYINLSDSLGPGSFVALTGADCEGGTGPTSPTTGPTSPTTGPTSPTTGPTSPTTGPTSPTTGPTSPTTGPTSPTTGPTSPTTGPTSPTTGPTSPTTGPTSPTTGPTSPTTGPTAPTEPPTPTATTTTLPVTG